MLRLSLPALPVGEPFREARPFSHYYDLPWLQKALGLNATVVGDARSVCRRKVGSAYLGGNRTGEGLVRWLVHFLTQQRTSTCILLAGLMKKLELPLMAAVYSDHLRFHGRYHAMVESALQTKFVGFSAIHLRLESDFVDMAYGPRAVFKGAVLEGCIRRVVPRTLFLYVSAGIDTFKRADYRAWVNVTKLTLVSAPTLWPSVHYGREEAAILEALDACGPLITSVSAAQRGLSTSTSHA